MKQLRLVRQCKWADIAAAINLSEPMLYAVISGKKFLSDKAVYRLADLERESGIEPPVTYPRAVSLAVVMSDAPPSKNIAKLERLADNLQAQLDELRQAINELKS